VKRFHISLFLNNNLSSIFQIAVESTMKTVLPLETTMLRRQSKLCMDAFQRIRRREKEYLRITAALMK
jgi:hypothetical protein